MTMKIIDKNHYHSVPGIKGKKDWYILEDNLIKCHGVSITNRSKKHQISIKIISSGNEPKIFPLDIGEEKTIGGVQVNQIYGRLMSGYGRLNVRISPKY